MAGYSQRLLVDKLGIKAGDKVCVKNPPPNYLELVAPLPRDVRVLSRLSRDIDVIHCFVTSRTELAANISNYSTRIKPNGMIWISWPKKSSKVSTNVTEDVIRATILPLGLVDVKVCAVDDIWSGLKVVIRKQNRT